MKNNRYAEYLLQNYYYSNFSSEDAILLITKNDCYLFTDGRYIAQSKEECTNCNIVIINIQILTSFKTFSIGVISC